MHKYSLELQYLEKFDMDEDRKVRLIENFYRLAHINFNYFLENDWEKIL